jgi:hypothetical protein
MAWIEVVMPRAPTRSDCVCVTNMFVVNRTDRLAGFEGTHRSKLDHIFLVTQTNYPHRVPKAPLMLVHKSLKKNN